MKTSKLQKYVRELLNMTFSEYTIRENVRPDWLISPNGTRLELDFYIDELKIAIEVQGIQHYKYIPYFHKNWDGFEKRKSYDIEKRNLCDGAGIKLIEIFSEMDANIEIGKIKNIPSHENLMIKIRHEISVIKYNRKNNDYIEEEPDWKHKAKRKQRKINKYSDLVDKLRMPIEEIKELYLWREKALAWHRKGKSNAENWKNRHLNKMTEKIIRERLKYAESEEDIYSAFNVLPDRRRWRSVL